MLIRILIHTTCISTVAYIYSSRRIDLKKGGWLIPFGLIVSPALLTDALVIHPDSMSIFIWTLLLIHILYDRYNHRLTFLIITGFLTGALIALKLTYLLGFPSLLVFMAYRWRNQGIGLYSTSKRVIIFSAITFFFFLAFCPFLVSNPLTMLKAFGGQLITKSSSQTGSLERLLTEYIPNLTTLPFLLLSAVGLCAAFRQKPRAETLLLIALFTLFSIPFIKTDSTYLRYAFPLLPILLIWAREGFEFITTTSIYSRKNFVTALFIGFIAVTITGAAVSVAHWRTTHLMRSNLQDLQSYIMENIQAGTTIALDEDMKYLVPENRGALERLIHLNRSRERILMKLNIPPELKSSVLNETICGYTAAQALFADHANQTDQLLRLQLEILKNKPEEDKGYSIYYYSTDCYAETTSLKPQELDTIPGISYVASFDYSEQDGVLIKEFTDHSGEPVYLFRSNELFNEHNYSRLSLVSQPH